MPLSSSADERPRSYRPAWIVIAAFGLTTGIALYRILPIGSEILWAPAAIWSAVLLIIRPKQSAPETSLTTVRRRLNLISCITAFVFLGMLRAANSPVVDIGLLSQSLDRNGEVDIIVEGQLSSLPIVHRRRPSKLAPRHFGSPHYTQFTLDSECVLANGVSINLNRTFQVSVDGRAADQWAWGDRVEVKGRLRVPQPPSNPGEFDAKDYYCRRGIAGLIYVDHSREIVVQEATGTLDARRWLGRLRQEAYRIIAAATWPDVRGTAMAILLGDRHELTSNVQDHFLASGLFHFLAISGLHMGILCMTMLRILHVLLVSRQRALLITLVVCVLYAFLTDLRPSVVRATLFFVCFVIGELLACPVPLSRLIAATAVIMMLWNPQVVFDIGAWLSFLAVSGLAWHAARTEATGQEKSVPEDSVGFASVMNGTFRWFMQKFTTTLQYLLSILLFSGPLVSATFHVISVVGVAVNLLLTPLAWLTLCLGFVTLGWGLLLPETCMIPGTLFSMGLYGIQKVADWCSAIPRGHLFLSDLPAWLIPTYYFGLLLTLQTHSPRRQKTGIVCLAVLMLVAVAIARIPNAPPRLTCTVLNVDGGHASVVEHPSGDVWLIDAGHRSQNRRVADTVCNFLWSRGHLRIDTVVITAAKPDRYNAVPGVISRIPVSQVVTAENLQIPATITGDALIKELRQHSIPLRTAETMKLHAGTAEIHISPEQGATVYQDQTAIHFPGETFRLPRDGDHAERTHLLIAPRHGAKAANPVKFPADISPDVVIVNASDDRNREYLENVYASSRDLIFTSKCGATTIEVQKGQYHIGTYLRRPAALFASVPSPATHCPEPD